MARFGQALDEVLQAKLDAAMVPQFVVKIGELLLRGEVALEKEIGGFLETALGGERLDSDAAIFEAGVFAVDEADGRLGNRDIRETGTLLDLAHGAP